MIKVRVPATSANLGVGYDCLGLALDEFATFYFEEIDQGLEIIGCDEAYCNEDNLIYQAFLKGMKKVNGSIKGLRIRVETNIPYARGLGSSATCIVAGLFAANEMFHQPLNKYQLFHMATEMEGHPDNVAPAIFGGLCVSFMDQNQANMIRFGVKRNLLFVTMIPDYEVSTQKARQVLPTSMTYKNATYQMGRCCALAKAIEIGNPVIIRKACTDRMQEPYRKALIPQYDDLKTLAFNHAMITMFISGSGSTMMALSQEEEDVNAFISVVKETYPTFDVRLLHATYDGASCEVI